MAYQTWPINRRRFANSPLYRLFQDHWEPFLGVYEEQFQHTFGALRSVSERVVEKFLDCGNPMSGFARIRCPECGHGMQILSFITDPPVVDRILQHLKWRPGEALLPTGRSPPAELKVAESLPSVQSPRSA